jgi:cobalt/nickel transport protein
MKKIISVITLLIAGSLAVPAHAHFQMIIPSTDIVSPDDAKEVSLRLMFIHPMEGSAMDMGKPAAFGVVAGGKKQDLLKSLEPLSLKGHAAYQAAYTIKRPGDHVFYVQPAPYWEPAEGVQIVHYTKVVVHALGLEEGWDAELGHEMEIVPLTRPYGLWTGNLFRGIVKKNGKPLPFAEVEVEYYNEGGAVKAPADAFVTQVIKADAGGVFSYAMPRAGWWGFAALSESEHTMKSPEGEDVPVEVGGVMWVRVSDMK